MGGLVSGLFDLFSGDPAKAQENQLQQLGDYESGIGKAGTTAAMNYYLGILSGDPTKTAETLSPEISTSQQHGQQAKNALAEFSPRSGGTAAAASNIDASGRGNIINLLGGLQQGAASNAGSLGTSNLNMSSGNINDVAGYKTARQKQAAGDWGQIGTGVGQIASLMKGKAGAPSEGMDQGTFDSLMQSSTVPYLGEGGGNAGLDLSSLITSDYQPY